MKEIVAKMLTNETFITVLVILFILTTGARAYYAFGRVYLNDNESAIVWRLGTYHATLKPDDKYWPIPLIDSIQVEDTLNVHQLSIIDEMLTQDLKLLEIKTVVSFDISDLKDYVLNANTNENSLRIIVSSFIEETFRRHNMDDLISSGPQRRDKLAYFISRGLQEYIDQRELGISVSTLNIERISLPNSEVKTAFDDIPKAIQEFDKMLIKAEEEADERWNNAFLSLCIDIIKKGLKQ